MTIRTAVVRQYAYANRSGLASPIAMAQRDAAIRARLLSEQIEEPVQAPQYSPARPSPIPMMPVGIRRSN